MIRVGISGWTFAPWRGSFYPKGLVQKKELEFASRKLNSFVFAHEVGEKVPYTEEPTADFIGVGLYQIPSNIQAVSPLSCQ